MCKVQTTIFINNEHTDNSELSESLHYSACLANLSNFVFQEFNIHENYFPSNLNYEDDILHFRGYLTPICLLCHLYSVASKCDLNTSMYLNLSSLFQN